MTIVAILMLIEATLSARVVLLMDRNRNDPNCAMTVTPPSPRFMYVSIYPHIYIYIDNACMVHSINREPQNKPQ